MRIAPLVCLPLLLATGGCISTAASIVKAPFQVAGKAVDWTTTSQEEADRNYGRKMRKQEAKEGRERKEAAKQCRQHPDDRRACEYSGYRAGY
ncbi:hypothetical protein NF700_05850 [Sphingomonadaceae bacterium OTU29MARTA1]|uniref:hypothetical protein n=1 Tax=Sphingomonas sp. Leaf37 TaxID=2876552 RepID=UPI001E3A0E3D|nr:hypothetical protein [Sphingomonas sp. Leaf37]USU06355.1 hypothetical protein NF699_06760 [Sphingomonadaceae bacterium OTU29LAMAA1]USU09790.1 hypothetical protein NF700_05850 [Sphingomonadaceae bacterium OTU29MARTA1]USU13255.1 hypothetical protein NF701_05315 [Sphingomonadaceae bacterium OTU29THOMA1]